jgi:hypothetical protein
MVAHPLSFIVGVLLLAACASASGPSLDPTRSNCDTVCTKAHDCLGTDENTCSDNCTSKSGSDSSYKASVAACGDCVVDKTCTEVASCTDNCLSTIAQ